MQTRIRNGLRLRPTRNRQNIRVRVRYHISNNIDTTITFQSIIIAFA